MRRMVLLSITLVLLLTTHPYLKVLSNPAEQEGEEEGDLHTFYFRKDGILSKTPPTKEKGNLTIFGSFYLENVTYIKDKIYFDLYFKVPLFNLPTPILIFFTFLPLLQNITANLTAWIINITGKEKMTLREFFKWLIENMMNITFTFTKGNFLQIIKNMMRNITSINMNYTVTVDIDNISKSKVIYIERENLSEVLIPENISLRGLIKNIIKNPSEYLQLILSWESIKIVRKRFAISGINLEEKKDQPHQLQISISSNEEILQIVLYLADIVQLMNETVMKEEITSYLKKVLNISLDVGKWWATFLIEKILLPMTKRISSSMGMIYETSKYPSNIRFYGKIAGVERFGSEIFYLKGFRRSGNKIDYILTKEEPTQNDTNLEADISTDPIMWIYENIFDEPVRIADNATIFFYMKSYNFIDIYPIEFTLYDKHGNSFTKIGSNTSKIFAFKYYNIKSIKLKISNLNYTLEAGHSLAVSLRINRTILFFLEPIINRPSIFFNSSKYPSYLEIRTFPLDNIKVSLTDDTKTRPKVRRADVVRYNITISNTGETGDTLLLSLLLYNESYIWPEGWRAIINLPSNYSEEVSEDWYYDNFSIDGKEEKEISIEIHPSPDAKDGDKIKVIFSAYGTYRGSDYVEDIIELKVGTIRIEFVNIPDDVEIEIGNTCKYTFRVKNTGKDVDDFIVNATSEHGWIDGEADFTIENLYPGNETEFSIVIKPPKEISILPLEDYLAVIIKSKTNPKESDTAIVTTTVIEPHIIEKISRFFGGISDSLKKQFGETGAIIFIVGLIIVIIFIIILTILLIKRKYIEIICLDRIKEISIDKKSKFDLTLKNITKQRLSCDIHIDEKYLADGWKVDLSEKEIILDPGEEKKLFIFVNPTEEIEPDAFTRIRVLVIPKEKPKVHSIDVLAMVKDAKIDLKIENVTHTPKKFKSGDTVTTRFLLKNEGNIKARNVKVYLKLNGKEANSVDVPEIPPNGYAEIEIPWIASTGRNDIHIYAEM